MTTAANVRVGVTGGIYRAPLASTLPTDALDPLDPAFVEAGYISDDGVSQSIDADVEDITAWQNGDVVRKVQTSHDLTYSFTLIETSAQSLEIYYGNYTVGDGAAPVSSTVEITGQQLPHGSWVLSVVDGTNVIRIVVPDGQITERGEIAFQSEDAIGYEVTVSCFPDSSGVKAYMYLDDTV